MDSERIEVIKKIVRSVNKEERNDDLDIKITPSQKNIGFLSDSFTVQTGKDELFLKLLPTSPQNAAAAKYNQMYAVEVGVYSDIFPRMALVAGEELNCVPKYFGGSGEGEGEEYVLLENLVTQGFTMQDKLATLRPAYVDAVMKALGHIHALAFLVNKKTRLPEINPIFQDMPRPGDIGNTTQVFIDFLRENCPELGTDEEEAIFEMGKNAKSHYASQRTADIELGDIETLTHRDLWNNNMMFRSNSATGDVDVRIVDWQLAKVGPIGLDLAYFLFACVSYQQLEETLDQILETYHQSFVSTMDAANSDVKRPTLQEIRENVERKAIYGFLHSVMLIPFVIELKTLYDGHNKEAEHEPDHKHEDAQEKESTEQGGGEEKKSTPMRDWMAKKYDERMMGEGRRERMIDLYRIGKLLRVF